MDSDLAETMSFWARWGSSCGTAFNAEDFLVQHPQWKHLKGHLLDMDSQRWELFAAGQENDEAD